MRKETKFRVMGWVLYENRLQSTLGISIGILDLSGNAIYIHSITKGLGMINVYLFIMSLKTEGMAGSLKVVI